jgi:hypothetical protein
MLQMRMRNAGRPQAVIALCRVGRAEVKNWRVQWTAGWSNDLDWGAVETALLVSRLTAGTR